MAQAGFLEKLKSKPILFVSTTFGLAGGVLTIILFLVLWYIVGQNQLNTNKIFDIVLLSLFVFFSIKDYKDNRNDGILHYWQGMSVGLSSFLVTAFLWGLFIFVFLQINPDPLQDYIQNRISLLNHNKEDYIKEFGEPWFRERLNTIPNITPFDVSLDYLKILPIIFPVVLILSMVMRRTPKSS